MANSKAEVRISKLARQIAKSGRHIGWHYVAGELHDKGEPLAFEVLGREPIKSEIEAICEAHRTKR